MKTMNKQSLLLRPIIVLFVMLIIRNSVPLFAETLDTNNLPKIQNLSRGDALFDQVIASVRDFNVAYARKKDLPPLFLLNYTVQEGQTLFSISSRLNLNTASIASLNRMMNPLLKPGDTLVLPNMPGLFVNTNAKTDLEISIKNRLQNMQGIPITFVRNKITEFWNFIPGADFLPSERLQFLGQFFIPPLTSYRISSRFGKRISPITGTLMEHNAVDLVAPLGSQVMAIADGVVRSTGFDPIYGNFVVIDHNNGFRSFYAHLLIIRVKKDHLISAGTIVGTLGNTGKSTGAHLHLELYKDGKPVNPELHIKF